MEPVEQFPILPSAISRGPNENFLASLIFALNEILPRWAARINEVLPKDGTEPMTGPLVLKAYTVASRPDPTDWQGAMIYVSDGGGGAVFQASDGTSWVSIG